MRKGIFSKLAVQNIRNNKSTYIPYMITCIFCIAMIYMMEFLRDCPTLDQAVRHAAEVRMILSTGEVVVVIFCVIFLIYSNSFLMKRRQKEIGLYNILGLERNHIGIVLLLETIFTTILSLTGGIAIGILASKLSLLLLLRLLHIPAVLGFYISTKGIITCFKTASHSGCAWILCFCKRNSCLPGNVRCHFPVDPSSESQKDSFKPSGRITSWQQHGRKRAESKMAYGTAWFYLSWYRLLPCHHNRITN